VVEVGRQKCSKTISDYAHEDVYSMDKTAQVYRMRHDRTIPSGPVKGGKKTKARITCAFEI
jgi:hypothetical protein